MSPKLYSFSKFISTGLLLSNFWLITLYAYLSLALSFNLKDSELIKSTSYFAPVTCNLVESIETIKGLFLNNSFEIMKPFLK